MTPAIQTQKTQLQLALHWITIIENCDRKIDAGNHVNYYKSVRNEAIGEYSELMASIIQDAIQADETAEQSKNIFDNIFESIKKITGDYNRNFYNIH